MCTLVLLRRPGHAWPILLAANRDERLDRPWAPPGRHWADRPEMVAGRDLLADGSWLGLNDFGVAAGVLNRVGTLGPAPGLRSRGDLVLEALDHADAAAAAAALAELNPAAYRPFNLVIADNTDAYWLRHRGADGPGVIEAWPLPAGLSMLTARDLNDVTSPRVRTYLPRFAQATPPDPDQEQWEEWERLLAATDYAPGDGPAGAMCIPEQDGFGTVCGALIALPGKERAEAKPRFRFAPGPPATTAFQNIAL